MDIILENICFRHEPDYPLIEELSYQFKLPGHYAIVGPSGCGKTSLLHLIAGLFPPNSGQCSGVEGSSQRERFSFVFTRPFLIRELNIYENIVLGLRKNQVNQQLLNFLLHVFDVEALQKYYPDQLSSGQQQRVSVIRALLRDSDCVLADEPAAHLDLARGTTLMTEMQKILREQHRGLICVTHQKDWLGLFDHVLELSVSEEKA